MGRRCQKIVSQPVGSAWQVQYTDTFTYDGWLPVCQVRAGLSGAITNHYLWGLDLAGQRTGRFSSSGGPTSVSAIGAGLAPHRAEGSGAGGIGGLVAIRVDGDGAPRIYLPVADQVGSICSVINAATLATVAWFSYTPYGTVQQSWYADTQVQTDLESASIRFQSKFQDLETDPNYAGPCTSLSNAGLIYFGYRYYNPTTGKWLSRDPLGESGGPNLTQAFGGDPVNNVDPLGLAGYFFGGTGNSLDEDAWSNVEILFRSWDNTAGHGTRWYVPGVMSGYAPDGTPYKGFHNTTAGMLKEGIWGESLEARAAEMMKHLKAQLAAKDKEVNIFGFSRGSLTALVFLDMIAKEVKANNPLFEGIHINQTVLFDNVEHTDRNTPHELPAGLKYTHQPLHLIAVDEQRKEFYDPDVLNIEGAVQIGFRGVHANVGGGQKNADMLAAQSLYFVAEAMRKSKLNAFDNAVLWNQMEQHGMHDNKATSTPSKNDRFFYTMGTRAFPKGMFLSPLFRFNRSLLKNPLDVNAFNEFNNLDMDKWAGGQMFSPGTGWAK
jgi:RHS repeat-associated protein